MQGREHPFILEVPRSYLPRQYRPPSESAEVVSAVPFVAYLADFSPAGEGRADRPGVISGRISWAPPNFVKRRFDGSWLNSYSQYSVRLGTRFDLEERTVTAARYFPAKLYVGAFRDYAIMIECRYVPADRPQLCEMSSQVTGKPLVQVSFRQTDLADWRRIADGVHALAGRWGA
jgi:hypothetical protein